jgi:sugar phosphate isomerase/epimerase
VTHEMLSRRGFIASMASAAAAGITLRSPASVATAAAAGSAKKPNSMIAGVQIGVITYSFRSMPDQSIEALLHYCLACGINAIELMGDPAEAFAGIPVNPNAARWFRINGRNFMANPPPMTADELRERDEVLAAQSVYQQQAAGWRAQASMAKFAQLRKMYNDAGVHIYAFKPATFEPHSTDAEVDYGFRAAKSLGASHVTVELPAEAAQTQRLGDAAVKHGMLIAYHQHLQATPTLWDQALAQSKGNGINLDLGHYVAADDLDALAFIKSHHARILNMHLKDRKNKANGQANLPWGSGDTPLSAALQLLRDRQYRFPAAIELEYDIPAGSDAVNEVSRCLEYCHRALTTR